MKNKKILIVHRFFWPDKSSCSSIMKNICSHLASNGYNVEVISSHPSYRQDSYKKKCPNVELLNGFKINRLYLPNESEKFFRRILNAFLIGISLIRKSLLYKPNLIIVTSIPPILGGFFGVLSAKISKSKFIYFCMDIHPELGLLSNDYQNSYLYNLLLKLDNWNCNNADKIIVHSKDMQKTLIHRGRLKKPNIEIINNFIKPLQLSSKAKFNNQSKSSHKKLKIIYAGNLGRFQYLDKIVDAMALITDHKNIELTFMGEGLMKNNLKEKVKKTGANIKFLNYLPQNEAQEIISQSDIGIVPLMSNLYKYAYPSKTISYLERSKPIIAIIERESELSIDMLNNEYGFQISQGDSRGLANLLINLEKDTSWKDKMGNNAYLNYKKKFTPEFILGKWSNLIKNLI